MGRRETTLLRLRKASWLASVNETRTGGLSFCGLVGSEDVSCFLASG